MKLIPASNAASTQASRLVVGNAAPVGEPGTEGDHRDLEVAVTEPPVPHGDRLFRSRHGCRRKASLQSSTWRRWRPSSTRAPSAVPLRAGGSAGALAAASSARWSTRRLLRVDAGACSAPSSAAAASPRRRRRRGRRRGSRPAWPSSIVCSAAVSSRVARPRRRRARRRQVDPAADARSERWPRLGRALLVTGEESVAQVKLRASRLGGCDAVEILAETELDLVCETLEQERPRVCVSTRCRRSGRRRSARRPGSVSQVREAAGRAPARREGERRRRSSSSAT